MTLVPLKDIPSLTAGENISAIAGTIAHVRKRYAGDNENGPWSFQEIGLADDGGTVALKFKNREPIPPTAEHTSIIVRSSQGAHGMNGLRVIDDLYKGNVRRFIQVTPSAEIAFGSQDDSVPEPDQPQVTPPAATPSQAPKAVQAQSKPAPSKSHRTETPAAKKAVWSYVQMYGYAMAGFDVLNEQRAAAGKPKMTPEHYHAACASVFIQLARDGYRNQ